MGIEAKDTSLQETATSKDILNSDDYVTEEEFLGMVADIIVEIIMREINESNRLLKN